MSFIEVSLTDQATRDNFDFFLEEFGFSVAHDYEFLPQNFSLYYPDGMTREEALGYINMCESVQQAVDGDTPVYHCATQDLTYDSNMIDELAFGELANMYTFDGSKRHVAFDPNLQGGHWGHYRCEHITNLFGGTLKRSIAKGIHTILNTGKQGNGVIYYIVDSGVDWTHPDFEVDDTGIWKVERIYDYYGTNIDDFSHGTHCASSGAGKVFGPAKMSPVKWAKGLTSEGSGTITSLTNACNALVSYHTANFPGVPAVCNCSWGGSLSYSTPMAALANAGIIPVCTAGNNGKSESFYPGSDPHTFTVAATDMDDQHCSFSNYGSDVDTNAPGRDILAATRGFSMDWYNGTSMATGFFSGVLCCILEGYAAPANATEVDAVIAAVAAYLPQTCPGNIAKDTGSSTTASFAFLDPTGGEPTLPMDRMLWPANALIAPASLCECYTTAEITPRLLNPSEVETIHDNIMANPDDWIPTTDDAESWMVQWTNEATWSTGSGDNTTTTWRQTGTFTVGSLPRIWNNTEMSSPSPGTPFQDQPFMPNGELLNGCIGNGGYWYHTLPIEVLCGAHMWDIPLLNRCFQYGNFSNWTVTVGTGAVVQDYNTWFPYSWNYYFQPTGTTHIEQTAEITNPDALAAIAAGNVSLMVEMTIGCNYVQELPNDAVQVTVTAVDNTDTDISVLYQTEDAQWTVQTWSPRFLSGIAVPTNTTKIRVDVDFTLNSGSICNGVFDGIQMRLYENTNVPEAETLVDAGKVYIDTAYFQRAYNNANDDSGYPAIAGWTDRTNIGVAPTLLEADTDQITSPGNWIKRQRRIRVPRGTRLAQLRYVCVQNAGTVANYCLSGLEAHSIIDHTEEAFASLCECYTTPPEFTPVQTTSDPATVMIGS
ncbi:MAG: S8 family serine peptidase [Synergistaceae bacterium]